MGTFGFLLLAGIFAYLAFDAHRFERTSRHRPQAVPPASGRAVGTDPLSRNEQEGAQTNKYTAVGGIPGLYLVFVVLSAGCLGAAGWSWLGQGGETPMEKPDHEMISSVRAYIRPNRFTQIDVHKVTEAYIARGMPLAEVESVCKAAGMAPKWVPKTNDNEDLLWCSRLISPPSLGGAYELRIVTYPIDGLVVRHTATVFFQSL